MPDSKYNDEQSKDFTLPDGTIITVFVDEIAGKLKIRSITRAMLSIEPTADNSISIVSRFN